MPKGGGEKRPGEEERTSTYSDNIYCPNTISILPESEINPAVLSLECIWETSIHLYFTDIGGKKKGRKWERGEVY